MGPLGCVEAAEPRLPVRKLPMKEEAGELPIKRLLAVDTRAGVSVGRGSTSKEPSAGDSQAPISLGFYLQMSKTPGGQKLPTWTPGGLAQGL